MDLGLIPEPHVPDLPDELHAIQVGSGPCPAVLLARENSTFLDPHIEFELELGMVTCVVFCQLRKAIRERIQVLQW